MRPSRRFGRSTVLVLLLLAFLGPWDVGPHPMYFPDLASAALRPLREPVLLLVAILALPFACFLAILAPTSRGRAIVYRLLAGGTLVTFGVIFSRFGLPDVRELAGAWGISLHLFALVLAVAFELVPARAPASDPAEAFR